MSYTLRFRRCAVLVGILLLLSATAVWAQSTAAIKGTVMDQNGAALAGAKITVTNVATAVARTVQSDSTGSYSVPSLPVGTYDVTVEATGMQPTKFTGLVLNVSQTVVQDVKLKVAQTSSVVTVEAEAPVVETNTMTVSQTINQRTVQEIPLNGRHFVDLGLLIPGSVTPPQNGFLTAPLRGQGSFAINTAGNREDTVNFMINGVNLNDMSQNQITFQPSINTVQEFTVDNSTYSAEYGRNSGAIINIATRSGTNSFHGEAFEFLRNNWLDARNFFNPSPALQSPFKRNNFGGDIGGPILKNKLFFFASYEGLRQRQGVTLNTKVLTDAQRTAVTDPTSVQLLQFIPPANLGANTFVGSATAPVNIDQGTADVSFVISADDELNFYYAHQADLRQEPTLQGNTVPGFGDTRASHRQIFTLNETHVFNSRLVNEARLGFNRIHITFTPNSLLDPTTFGINDGNSGATGLPQISIGTTSINFGGPATFPQGRGDTTVVLSDTLSYLHGNHSFKFGGEFRRFYNNNFNGDAGTVVFNSVADFQLGQARTFNITPGSRPSRIAINALGFFIMDNWKVRPSFTVELGLRYDWNATPTEAFDRFVVFDPATSTLVRTGSPYQQSDHNFEPRLGFAWDIFHNGKTILRAGYGYFVDQPVANTVSPLTANPPFTIPLAFQSAAPASFLAWGNLAPGAKAGGLAPSTIDQGFNNAYTQSWNLNVQREITPTLAIMVGYFGSKGTHLRVLRNLNQKDLITGLRPFPTLIGSSSVPCPSGTLTSCVLNNISEVDSASNANYNALWITANKRFSHNLQFNASYTWSKSLDYNSLSSQGTVGLQDSNNPRGDYGLSDFDVRNRFVINGIYDLPFKGNRFKEGWELSSIFSAQGGNPINIVTNVGFTGVTNTVRPDLLMPVGITGSPLQWFSNATVCNAPGPGCAFLVPTSGGNHFGDLGRNTLIGPGFYDWDFSMAKTTKITERVDVRFSFDAFDSTNHANFGQPGRIAIPGSATFGVITSTRFPVGDSGSARQLQFGLKLQF